MSDSAEPLPGTLDLQIPKAVSPGRPGEEVASWNRLAGATAMAPRATPREGC